MNLYKIILEHYAPKDKEVGIFTYLTANSDEDIYEWLKNEPTLQDGRWITVSWVYKDEECFTIYNDDCDPVGEETFKERMIRLKGDINDDEADLDDLYYGRTLFGWELIKESVNEQDVNVLKKLGISIETA